MSYRTGLDWMAKLGKYNDDEVSVLMALSHDKYKWRTRDRLTAVTKMPREKVDSILSEFITNGVVRPSMSKRKKVIFGLVEIVGESRRNVLR